MFLISLGSFIHWLLMTTIFNIKVMSNLLSVSHVFSCVCNWFLLLILSWGILLLHLYLLLCNNSLIVLILSIMITCIFLTWFTFNNLWFKFQNVSWLRSIWHRKSSWLSTFRLLLRSLIELRCVLNSVNHETILTLITHVCILVIYLVNQMSNILAILFNMLYFLIIEVNSIILHHLAISFPVTSAWWVLLIIITLDLLHLKKNFLLFVVKIIKIWFITLIVLTLKYLLPLIQHL